MSTISSIVYMLFTCLITYFAFTNLLPYKIPFYKRAAILLLLAIIYSVIGIKSGQISIIICITGDLLILSFKSQQKLLNCSLSLIGYLLNICLNYTITTFLGLLGLTVQELYIDFALPFTIFYCILIYIITYVLGRYIRRCHIDKLTSISPRLQLLLFFEVGLSVAVYIINIIFNEVLGYPQKLVMLNGVLFLCFFLITMTIFVFAMKVIQNETRLTYQLAQYENLQEYTVSLEDMYRNLRSFRHDYLNILSTLSTLVAEKDMEGLTAYFTHTILPTKNEFCRNNDALERLVNIKNPELKGLFYAKLLSAIEKGLQPEFEAYDPVSNLPVDMIDLVKILGIFMDNAIESALESEKKYFSSSIIVYKEHVLFIIKNSCDKNVDIKSIYLPNVSSKGGMRGIGLFTAQRLMDKYDNLSLTTEFKDHIFKQKLDILF